MLATACQQGQPSIAYPTTSCYQMAAVVQVLVLAISPQPDVISVGLHQQIPPPSQALTGLQAIGQGHDNRS